MKYWLAIINLFAVAILTFMVSIINNQIIIHERDYESEVLQAAVNYSTQYAIEKALTRSDLDRTADNLLKVQIDPSYVIDDFSAMMCCCYNMSVSNSNKALVKSSIDGGLLATDDGYYKLMISDKPVLVANETNGNVVVSNGKTREIAKFDATGAIVHMSLNDYIDKYIHDAESDTYNPEYPSKASGQKVTNIEKNLVFSVKLPYMIPIKNDTGEISYYMAVTLSDGTNKIYTPGGGGITRNDVSDTKTDYEDFVYYQNGTAYQYELVRNTNTYKNAAGSPVPESKMNDTIKIEEINIRLEQELNNSVKQIAMARGNNMTYNIYLPTTTTTSGVNPIKNSSLIIAISEASFAGKYAYLSEPSIGGFKFIQAQRYVIFRDEQGTVRYAYANQAKDEDIIDSWYSLKEVLSNEYTTGSGSKQKGAYPSAKYLNLPLRYDVQ